MALEQLNNNRGGFAKQFTLALQLCSQVHSVLGAYAPLYDCVSDIYLNLRRFHDLKFASCRRSIWMAHLEALLELGEFRQHARRFHFGSVSFAASGITGSQSPSACVDSRELGQASKSEQEKPAFLSSWEPSPLTQHAS